VDIQNLSHTLAEGDRIVNANAALGSVRGRILHIATLAELPALDGSYWAEMKAATIRRILAEWCVELVALIGYHYGRPGHGQELRFFILQIDGNWYDLKRRPLDITLEITA
jgi:hypothetical protein